MAAMLMVGLLAMAALVVDIANTTQVRRQAQNAADAAVLAAAQDLPDLDAVVDVAKAYAWRNLGIADDAWAGCSDPEALSIRPDPATSCISVDTDLTTVRVRLPNRRVDTFFGGVIGVDSLEVSAIAVAELTEAGGGADILPVAIPPDQTGRLCIVNAGSNIPACADRTTGKFGEFASPRLHTFVPHNQNPGPNSLLVNLAMGLDHPLEPSTAPPGVCDGTFTGQSPCTTHNVGTGLTANHIQWTTGNQLDPVSDGLVAGSAISMSGGGSVSFCGRLARPDATPDTRGVPNPGCGSLSPTTPKITVLGVPVNGRHLAYWMEPWAREMFYGSGATGTQPVAADGGAYAAGDLQVECFLAWYRYAANPDATSTVSCGAGVSVTRPGDRSTWRGMFSDGISTDPRFGMIPEVDAADVPGQSQASPIEGFRAAYIYWLHEHGGGQNRKVHAVDAWVFDHALIGPEDATPGDLPSTSGLRRVNLVG